MIPDFAEILRGVYGAWRLIRLDPQGLVWFGDRPEDFWKSFFAAVIVAPGYALLLAMHLLALEEPLAADPAEIAVLQAFAYVIRWLAFPLAAFYICRAIGKERAFVRFIVARNWLAVPMMALYLPAAAISWTAVLGGLSDLPQLAAFMALLFYFGYVARTALAVSLPLAAAFVALDLFLDVLIDNLVQLTLA